MALSRVARFMGVDVSALVTSWGSIEQIKDVLLVNATFMSGEHSIELVNQGGAFSPGAGGSLAAGLNWYNQLLEIVVDGRTVYAGYVKNIKTNNSRTLATITSENIFKRPAETVINATGAGQNPADVMLAIALMGAPESLVDRVSFATAGAAARAAGATIDYSFPVESNVTVLAALQQIGALSSISCFVLNNKITARAFHPYQGNGSGLKFQIRDEFVREWGDFGYDFSSFNNRVTVGFAGPGALTFNDPVSQKVNNIVREVSFPSSGAVVSSNAGSATFFGTLYLQRAALRKGLLNIAGGRELKDVQIGDRFPVTNDRLGLNNYPMEAIEVHQNLDTEEFEIHLAQIGLPPTIPLNPLIIGMTVFEGSSGPGVLDIPVTVPAGAEQLLCCFNYVTGVGGAAAVSDLLDGTPLTYLGPGAVPIDGEEFPQFWSRANPVAGVHTIRVDTSPSQQFLVFAALSLSGVNPAVPFGPVAGGNVNPVYPAPGSGFGPFPSTSDFVTVASDEGDLVIDVLQFDTFTVQPPFPVPTTAPGQAELWLRDNTGSGSPPVIRGAGSRRLATGPGTTMSWTTNISQELRQSGIAVKKL